MPKPYSPSDMVTAVGHLKGDETLPRPVNLEVFGEAPDEVIPEIA